MVRFIDLHREEYGVEPICAVLPIAPSTYYRCVRQREHPELRSARAKRDAELLVEIERVWRESGRRYGVRKVWRQLLRETFRIPRCAVERLMRDLGIGGVRRCRRVRTTIAGPESERPGDFVERQFSASGPNRLWVADITYVPVANGHVYTSFVVDVFSRRIVGWRVSSSLKTDLALDALEQAICARGVGEDLIHHSDRGSQYLSIRYTERLKDAGIQGSVGSVGNSYDNALAETINGLYKAEVIYHDGPWRGLIDVEFATLKWVHWFNNNRLFEKLGYIPPAEFEENFYNRHASQKLAA